MVVDDLHLGWALSGPSKDDAPLLIDADRVGARAFSFERFETIARGDRQVFNFAGAIELNEFA
jgi:hypothetical protein